jgi:aspartate-semialdehyde dehydrogenase
MTLYLSDANVCARKDDVFVGRIRRDESQANTLNMWIADNLRKGAATNTIQIAEYSCC